MDEDDAIVVDDGAMILYRDGEREGERERERRRKGSFCEVCAFLFLFLFHLWHPCLGKVGRQNRREHFILGFSDS